MLIIDHSITVQRVRTESRLLPRPLYHLIQRTLVWFSFLAVTFSLPFFRMLRFIDIYVVDVLDIQHAVDVAFVRTLDFAPGKPILP